MKPACALMPAYIMACKTMLKIFILNFHILKDLVIFYALSS